MKERSVYDNHTLDGRQLTERSKRDWIASGQPNYRGTAIQTQWNISDFRTMVRSPLLLLGKGLQQMISYKPNTNLTRTLQKALTEMDYLEDPVTIGHYSSLAHSQYHQLKFHNFAQRAKIPMKLYTMMIQTNRRTRTRQAHRFRLLKRAHRRNLLLQGVGRKSCRRCWNLRPDATAQWPGRHTSIPICGAKRWGQALDLTQ